jgi:ribosomal protein L17
VLKGVDVMMEVDIPEGQEEECMRMAPGRYLWYAVLASKAKVYRERMEAQIAIEKRGEWSETKVTESFISELVRFDDRWKRAREIELLFNDLATAFEARMETVRSVTSWLKSERGGNLNVLKAKVNQAMNRSSRQQ